MTVMKSKVYDLKLDTCRRMFVSKDVGLNVILIFLEVQSLSVFFLRRFVSSILVFIRTLCLFKPLAKDLLNNMSYDNPDNHLDLPSWNLHRLFFAVGLSVFVWLSFPILLSKANDTRKDSIKTLHLTWSVYEAKKKKLTWSVNFHWEVQLSLGSISYCENEAVLKQKNIKV